MSDVHTWERVYFNVNPQEHYTESVARFRVPGGWLYIHSLTHDGWFKRDHIETVFVPDAATS